ncbi:polyprenyl synthetase family protein [Carnobacteriaceae bacterium zg-ZUI78]|nr:polyprenyl synthetase family protein [Carnobacteriaceae bacterium zg-ZUI78]
MNIHTFKTTITDFEQYLENSLTTINDIRLKEAMHYSLTNGGKRVRPMLLLATIQALGKDVSKGYPIALALEYIHTYSLIHDDLPAMDNDDYRRGKLTNHKQFDEATAILAGDAFNTKAFELICQSDVPNVQKVLLVSQLAICAGPNGMIGGQMGDIQAENQHVSLDTLKSIHARKTGDLIRYATFAGAVLSNACEKVQVLLEAFSRSFGLAFQIHNDLKDVECSFDIEGKIQGKDAILQKSTYTSLLGISGARESLFQEISRAEKAIDNLKKVYPTLDSELLLDFLNYVK